MRHKYGGFLPYSVGTIRLNLSTSSILRDNSLVFVANPFICLARAQYPIREDPSGSIPTFGARV